MRARDAVNSSSSSSFRREPVYDPCGFIAARRKRGNNPFERFVRLDALDARGAENSHVVGHSSFTKRYVEN